MKISICGKGGSGKSAITSLLAEGITSRGYQAVVIDADESNTGLHRMLGLEAPPVPLLDLAGGRKEVKNVLPKTPIAQSEHEINIIGRVEIPLDDIPAQYIASRDGVSLLSVGKILQAQEGCACPMGVLSREFLRKLVLKVEQIAIVDMEAGVEHFGRGVEFGVDAVLLVVDPSFESLELAGRMKVMASQIGITNVWAVLNRITTDEMTSKLRAELVKRNVDVIGVILYDTEILDAGLDGRTLQSAASTEAINSIIDALLSVASK
jgi:CO dehydrogenase maturation factor